MTGRRQYAVYIMASDTRTLYIGFTGDLAKRAYQHKEGKLPGFTRKYKCHRLVYYELFDRAIEAIQREKQLKRWTRSKKLALIATANPDWRDLYEDL